MYRFQACRPTDSNMQEIVRSTALLNQLEEYKSQKFLIPNAQFSHFCGRMYQKCIRLCMYQYYLKYIIQVFIDLIGVLHSTLIYSPLEGSQHYSGNLAGCCRLSH